MAFNESNKPSEYLSDVTQIVFQWKRRIGIGKKDTSLRVPNAGHSGILLPLLEQISKLSPLKNCKINCFESRYAYDQSFFSINRKLH